MADWFGWIAALLGTVGGLLLARPLFILLQYREALDALVQALDAELAPDDLKKQFVSARKHLSAKVFAGRKVWKRWAYPGVAALGLSAMFLALQFVWLL